MALYQQIIERELQPGLILYNPPTRMLVGEENRVEVRISRELSKGFSEGLQGKGDPRVEKLLVGTRMRAKLEGDEFEITMIGSDVQQLAATGFLEWRWEVTPTTSGSRSLFFTISALYGDDLIEQKVLERRVDATVNPVYSFKKWIGENWGPLIAAVVGIVGIAEAYRRMRRKDSGE
ncbi:MAG: hypothetical protein ACRDRW_14820 [Pseudonocardiaceae bacterium]